MLSMYLETPRTLEYKSNNLNSHGWETLKQLVVATEKAYQKYTDTSSTRTDTDWLIFYGIITDEWHLVWESTDYDTFSTMLPRLSANDLYPVAVWGLNAPWVHSPQPLSKIDLSASSIRASVEMAVLLRTRHGFSRFCNLNERQRKDLAHRIHEFITEHSPLLDVGTFASVDDIAKVVYGIMLVADEEQEVTLLDMDVVKPNFAMDFTRSLFVFVGFDPALLWVSHATVTALGENGLHRALMKVVMATVEEANRDDNVGHRHQLPIGLCIAGLKLLDRCSWIDGDTRMRVIEAAMAILLKSTIRQDDSSDIGRSAPRLTQEASHLARMIQSLIMTHGLAELSAKYPEWRNIPELVLGGNWNPPRQSLTR